MAAVVTLRQPPEQPDRAGSRHGTPYERGSHDAAARAALEATRAAQMRRFVEESNRIEGMMATTQEELDAHAAFFVLRTVRLEDMERFVSHIAAVPLRRAVGQNVRVGSHFPPPGGPQIEAELRTILANANTRSETPYAVHLAYETLHPFIDGNGRSGRALWAWMMLRSGQDPFALPFLHRWYYQSLDDGQGR